MLISCPDLTRPRACKALAFNFVPLQVIVGAPGTFTLNSKVFNVKSKSKSSRIAPTSARSILALGNLILPDWRKKVAFGRGKSLILNLVLLYL